MARYWVGGDGAWSDNTNHWASTSGGAPGASLPTSADDVFFDTNSHTTNYTVTLDSLLCVSRNITFAAPASGNVTLVFTAATYVVFDCYGSWTAYTGFVMSPSNYHTVNFKATGAATVTRGSGSFPHVFFSGSGGTWTMQDAFVQVGNCTAYHQSGTLDFNGYNSTFGGFASTGSTARTLTLGTGTLSCINAGFVLSGSNLTFNPGTSLVKAYSLDGNGATFYDFEFFNTSGPGTMTGMNTFRNLTYSGGGNANGISFAANQTITGTLAVSGASAIGRPRLLSSVIGTARTLTAANVSMSNVDLQDITGAGAGDWDLSAITGGSGDCGGNSGITFTTPATQYWVGGTGNWNAVAEWASTSGGAGSSGRVPLPQDTARFDANSFSAGSQTVSLGVPRIGSMDWTGVTNNPALYMNVAFTAFGSITLASGMSIATFNNVTLAGRGASTLTTAGKSLGGNVTISVVVGTVTLGDALTSTGSFVHTSGTFDANNFNVTFLNAYSQGSLTRVLTMGSGTWTITWGGSLLWNISGSGLTLNPGTSTIKLVGTLTGAAAFSGNGLTYHNVWNATTGAYAIHFSGSNTFNEMRHDSGRTWLNTAGTTQSFASLVADGVTIGSITAASHTLTKTGGGIVAVDGVTVSRSTATPGSTFYATGASTDGGNNSGWTFGPAVMTTDATAAFSTWVAPAATAIRQFTTDATAAFSTWTAPAATARTRYTVPASAALSTWVAPSASAQIKHRRAIAVSCSATAYNIATSSTSYQIEVS